MIYFPRGTEMFHFPRLSSAGLCVQPGITPHYQRWVSPFGNPRVKGYKRLTVAYRSCSRPSSTLGAKASTVCPYYLDGDQAQLDLRAAWRVSCGPGDTRFQPPLIEGG